MPQVLDDPGKGVEQRVHLLRIVLLAQGEPDARARLVGRQADRRQHVRGLDSTAGAGRTARDRHALQVQSNDQRLPFQTIEADVRRVRNSSRSQAIYGGTLDPLEDAAFKPVTQIGEPFRFSGHFLSSQCRRLAETNDAGHILRAGTIASFMAPAVLNSPNFSSLPHIERSGALRTIKLVGAEAKQVNAELFHFGRIFPVLCTPSE